MKKCCKCLTLKCKDDFHKRKNSPDGYKPRCKLCVKEDKRIYYINNREKVTSSNKRYREYNKESILDIQRVYREKTRGVQRSYCAKRRASKLQATPKWSEKDLIEIVYKKAKWLEELTGINYHVDHIVPLQGENVCGLHCWNNLQILEASLNCSKGNRNGLQYK